LGAAAAPLFGEGTVPTPAPGPTGPDASILVIALAAIAVVAGIGAWRRGSRKPA
jgi:MYXO-CTERM domain-containing protein